MRNISNVTGFYAVGVPALPQADSSESIRILKSNPKLGHVSRRGIQALGLRARDRRDLEIDEAMTSCFHSCGLLL